MRPPPPPGGRGSRRGPPALAWLLPAFFALSWAWPGALAALDPAGALRWWGAPPCRAGAATARPLLLRPGPDGAGVYLACAPVPKGRDVVAVSPETGFAIAQGQGLGGRLVSLRGLGHPRSTLPVEAVEGISAVLVGRGLVGVLGQRPNDLPVRGWQTAGSAGGIPTGVPVAGPDPGQGPLALEPLAGVVGLLWSAE